MRLTLRRCTQLVVVAALVMLTTSAAFSQTALNFVYLPEVNAANGEYLAYPIYIQKACDRCDSVPLALVPAPGYGLTP